MEPLRFEPIFKSMLWGGRRLPGYLGMTAPHDDPIGEAWVLSDVDGSLSRVAAGEHKGRTLREVIADEPAAVFGAHIPADGRFPLLLKFIDARRELSVQVHPDDEQAVAHKGLGHRGKTEAWVILDANSETSRIYAGFKPGMTAGDFRSAMTAGMKAETLNSFTPKPGDCVFLRAGTVHAIGADILLFEVQQTSDITYRLYDWDRVDAKTGMPRELHVDAGLDCVNFAAGPCEAVVPNGKTLVDCRYFSLHRTTLTDGETLGRVGECRVVVVIGGSGTIGGEPVRVGSVLLLPAAGGVVPCTGMLELLECGLGVP